MKTRLRLLLLLVPVSALFFTGCPTDSHHDSFEYLRSPITFRVDTVPADHPFCFSGATPFATQQECVNARKYRLVWERPEDTAGFTEYRIYVDTTPPNAAPGELWNDVRKDRGLAAFVLGGAGRGVDSLIFVLSDTGHGPVELNRDTPRIVALDTSNRIDSLGKLVFGITTRYAAAGLDGQPRFTWIITNDRFPPFPIQPVYTPRERTVQVAWSRPRDPTSFFNPAADSGLIRRYVLKVVRGGVFSSNRAGLFAPQVLSYTVGGTERAGEVSSDSFTTLRGARGRRFLLPDSQRVINRDHADARDSLKVTLGGLTPQDTVDLSLWAVDSAGNATDTTLVTRVLLTDTTEPSTPVLSLLGAATRNQFVYSFTASRDSVQSGSGLVPAATPNANILEYRLSRRLIAGSSGGSANFDTVIQVGPDQRGLEAFQDTARYLPPGATYRLFVQAVDSTGHLSGLDSLDVSTPSASFTGSDTGCPPGFIAIPGGRFVLGDTSSARDADEWPAGYSPTPGRFIKSFCIEPYEHRNDSGGFTTRVTWEQADAICLNLSPGDSTHLCTEAEWERSCEGTDPVPLVYGIQSENRDPGNVRYSCNIGTGDSAMAQTLALRNPDCLSNDGVFNLSGNLAEWVLDPYSPGAYARARDTLIPGVPLTALTDTSTRGFRGSHYLNTNQSPITQLKNARCSNRDFPTQVRPRPFAGCVSSADPQLVLLYNNTSKPPRCLVLPDSLTSRHITAVSTSRDSTKVLVLLDGVAQPVTYTLPTDTVYRGFKPITASLSARALAVVTFDNADDNRSIVDTLDATEMRDTSDAVLSAIFTREAAPPWSVRRVDGRYAVQFYYAYTQQKSLKAKAYYSNPVLGFRCCSRPRP